MSKRYLPFGGSAFNTQSVLKEIMTQGQLDKQRDAVQRKVQEDAARRVPQEGYN